MAFMYVVAGVYGAVYGSFLNVLMYRLPREESVVAPRSRCPRCKKPIAWYDNLPILSWLILRGRGRCCGVKISPRYPLVECAGAVIAVVLLWRWDDAPAWAAAATAACGILLAVSYIDWHTFLIPDELSVGLLIGGILLSWLNPYFAGGAWWSALLHSLGGALFGLAVTWAIAAGGEAVLKREALGGGDVKLLAAVGAWSGATGAFDCLMIGSVLGSIYGVARILLAGARRQDAIPFGPFLAVGAAVNFFYLLPIGWPLILNSN